MRKTVFFCDRCGKEINGTVIQIGHRILENESGFDLEREWAAELCQECFREIDDVIVQMVRHPDVHFYGGIIHDYCGVPAAPEPEEPKPEELPKQKKAEHIHQSKVRGGQNKKLKLDLGKMGALLRAGWKIKDIAAELHCSETTVYNRQQEAMDFLDKQGEKDDIDEGE